MALDKAVDSVALEADLTSVADAIRTKSNTTANLAFPDEFVNAVNSISTGVNVQVKTGSITTSSSGTATVNCGFRPDLLVFHIANFNADGESYESVIALPIAASKSSSGKNLDNCAVENSSFASFIECWPESITNTGVSVGFYRYSSSPGYVSRKTYNWTAIKYTA